MYRVREMLANPIVLNSHFGAYTNFVNLLGMAERWLAGFRFTKPAYIIGPG